MQVQTADGDRSLRFGRSYTFLTMCNNQRNEWVAAIEEVRHRHRHTERGGDWGEEIEKGGRFLEGCAALDGSNAFGVLVSAPTMIPDGRGLVCTHVRVRLCVCMCVYVLGRV